MSERVFVLGAGASRQSGCPLMGDFLDIARRLYPSTASGSEARAAGDSVFAGISALQAVHSKAELDIDNLESVFAAFEMARLFRMPLGDLDAARVAKLTDDLRKLIIFTLEEQQHFPLASGNACYEAPRPYAHFVKHLVKPEKRSAILTFNYDIGLDYALAFFDLTPAYKLGTKDSDGFPLLKLHGSLNWGQCQECRKVHMIPIDKIANPEAPDAQFRHRISKLFSGLQCCGRSVSGPLIVPPTWSKADHHENISSVWVNAAKHLSEARDLIIIGYSLPDSDMFFRYLYALGAVGKDPLRKFIVVDPDPRVEERFKHLLGPAARARFEFVNSDFDNAISSIQNALS